LQDGLHSLGSFENDSFVVAMAFVEIFAKQTDAKQLNKKNSEKFLLQAVPAS
jgi:hypothetical protein